MRAIRPANRAETTVVLVVTVVGAVAGAVTTLVPYFTADADGSVDGRWVTVGILLGAGAGFGAGLLPPVREFLTNRRKIRRVNERAAGDTTIRTLLGHRDRWHTLGIHPANRDDQHFAPRDLEPVVRNDIAEGRRVLVVGPSMCGKTRLAAEVLRQVRPDAPLLLPDEAWLSRVVDDPDVTIAPGTVVFLDDIDGFLPGSLNPTLLDRWTECGFTVVATITQSQYDRLSAQRLDRLPGSDVLRAFTRRHLGMLPTSGELAALAATPYAELKDQAEHLGLAAVLGGAPQARDKMHDGQYDHPRGWQLVRVAVDWRRAGLGSLTRDTAERLLQSLDWPYPPGESEGDAWTWATEQINQTVCLLRWAERKDGHDHYVALDLLADEAALEDAPAPIPALTHPTLEVFAAEPLTHRQALALAAKSYEIDGRPSRFTANLVDSVLASGDATALLNATLFRAGLRTDRGKDRDLSRLLLAEARGVSPISASVGSQSMAAGAERNRALYDWAEKFWQSQIATNPKADLGGYAEFLSYIRRDTDGAEAMYEQADPSADNLGIFAVFLETVRRDTDRAEAMYERAIAVDPRHARNLGNYADFLSYVLRDADRAEAMYERAVAANQHHANNLGSYAVFLEVVRRDDDRAEVMYRQAVNTDPYHALNLWRYATFLESHRDDDRAEIMYQRAESADPDHVGILVDYAEFLDAIRSDPDGAEALYERAVAAATEPGDVARLESYAPFLRSVGDDNARVEKLHDYVEEVYRRAEAEDPDDPQTLISHAIFLETVRRDIESADAMYGRAVAADPGQAWNLARYAVFLEVVRHDIERAEAMYEQAESADPRHPGNLQWYASFLDDSRRDLDRAEAMWERVIAIDPGNPWNLARYALFLEVDRRDADHAEQLYRRAVDADPFDAQILGWYARFVSDVRRDPDRAEVLFERTVAARRGYRSSLRIHANGLWNFSRFLKNVRRDSVRSDEMAKQARETYERAAKAHPADAWGLGEYANALEGTDDDRAEAMYDRALESDPLNLRNLGNYADFLADRPSDPDRAEAMYERALAVDSGSGTNLARYANFLYTVRRDYDRADVMYDRAVAADPAGAWNLVNYANFLRDVRRDHDRAEEMYRRAVIADPGYAFALGHYALFLETVRNDPDRAEDIYGRALALPYPDRDWIIGQYAQFIADVRHDGDRAEEMYERAVSAEPENAWVLCRYALFLERNRRDANRAEVMFERALLADALDVDVLRWYAGFIHEVLRETDRAEAMWERAVSVDPEDAFTLVGYALFLHAEDSGDGRTEIMYSRAVGAEEQLANGGLANLAQLQFAHRKDQEGCDLSRSALANLHDDDDRAECWFYLFAHSADGRKEAGLELRALVGRGVQPYWSFEPNLRRLREDGDERLPLMETLAKVLRGRAGADTLDQFEEWCSLGR